MIRTLILLSPVYVSIFWFISLRNNKKKNCTPTQLLSFFMLVNAICFFGQFLFFAPYPHIFPFWEPLLALFGGIAFPLYYIYFRLLTVDNELSIRKHGIYLVVPILIALVYTVGIFRTPFEQYKAWLYDDSLFPASPEIQFLGIMRKIVKINFVVMLLLTYILNSRLLYKYAHKAEQYYSDVQDGKYNNAKRLNYFLIFISVSALLAHIVGRRLLLPSDMIINSIWLIFAFSLYGIGYMGFTQKSINPAYELEKLVLEPVAFDETNIEAPERKTNIAQQQILNKILHVFEQDKIYLNSNLNIMDVVQLVGTNRSYISSIINTEYNQNFCAFVNGYRMRELEQVFASNPNISNEHLSEKCGFGSFNSMKRTIESSSGMTINAWKQSFSK